LQAVSSEMAENHLYMFQRNITVLIYIRVELQEILLLGVYQDVEFQPEGQLNW